MNPARSGRIEVFAVANGLFLLALALLCILPFVHILAISLSTSYLAAAGQVSFLPVGFTLASYEAVIDRRDYWQAMLVSVQRLGLGVSVNMVLTVLAAYPLSKEARQFPRRTFYVWVMFVTMLFSGGLIPTYMVVRQLGLIDSIWALILPAGVPVWNVLILLNFFRRLPVELEESAALDGAGHWTILWKIYIPTSLAALATLVLFAAVTHWNAWFDGMIYMRSLEKYPLQTFLRSIIAVKDMTSLRSMTLAEARDYATISDRTLRSAQILIGALPILLLYPFLQRYFVKGIVIGSVKG